MPLAMIIDTLNWVLGFFDRVAGCVFYFWVLLSVLDIGAQYVLDIGAQPVKGFHPRVNSFLSPFKRVPLGLRTGLRGGVEGPSVLRGGSMSLRLGGVGVKRL